MENFQTRSEVNGIHWYETMKEAIQAAKSDESIWKISFTHLNERIRLVRKPGDRVFYYEPIFGNE